TLRFSGANVDIRANSPLSLVNASSATGTLRLETRTAGHAITQNGGGVSGTRGATLITAGNGAITLSSGTNNFWTLTFTGGNVSIVESSAMNLTGTNTANGTLSLQANAGGMSQSGGV